ncbi:ATP-binding protein [Candidatus Magnetominusculus dajiuhuensis]|uniref:ATP-binding protein n=1 Tax=Candidatus Magnetominusculus dajiuhuensis TaxID=3137712 RepID=UPI003B43B85D
MLNRLKRLLTATLRRQLTLGIVLVVSLSMALFVWDMTNRQLVALIDKQADRARSLASSVGMSSAIWVASRDYSGLQEIVNGLTQFPGMQYIIVLNLHGEVLAHNDESKRGLYLSDLPQEAKVRLLQHNKSLVDVASPIMMAGRHIGWVRIGLDYQEIHDRLHDAVVNGIAYALIAIVLSTLLVTLTARYMTRRLYTIAKVADAVQTGNLRLRAEVSGEDEAAKLALQFNNMLERLSQETAKRIAQENMLMQQSKMAAMGEMMAAVAHQWRQPLSNISYLIQDIRDAWDYKELDDTYLNNTVKGALIQIDFMSSTLNDFKNFFKPAKEKETFDLIEIAANVFSLLSHQFKTNSIRYQITCHIHDKSFNHYAEVVPCTATTITSYKNYFSHVILNIISNAKDAIVDKKKGLTDEAEEGIIRVDAYRDGGTLRMEISDNGGGIPDEIIDRIFDPYFTTKEGEKGTGIGLYMSKMIVEDVLGGKISTKNINGWAVFTIELNEVVEGFPKQ